MRKEQARGRGGGRETCVYRGRSVLPQDGEAAGDDGGCGGAKSRDRDAAAMEAVTPSSAAAASSEAGSGQGKDVT
jgi:hypothetical protein